MTNTLVVAGLVFEKALPRDGLALTHWFYKKPGSFSALIVQEKEMGQYSLTAKHTSMLCATSHLGTLREVQEILVWLKSI